MEHSSSELRVIGTTFHRVDSFFLHFTMHTWPIPDLTLYVVQLTLSLSLDELCTLDYTRAVLYVYLPSKVMGTISMQSIQL